MSKSHPEVRSLARALLDGQSAGHGADARAEAVERVLERLAARISPLVGTGGFVLLLQRSLRRTQGEHPWLGAVQAGSEAPWRLAGLAEAARKRPPEEAAAAAQAFLADLIGLLARFLGADMAIRLVRQSFPEVTRRRHKGSGFRGDHP
jgi:hypothetical protein